MRSPWFTGVPLVLLLMAVPLATLLMLPGSARAQSQSSQRSVDGKVVNAEGQPVEKAVVFLKDTHSLTIKSMTTSKDGLFHFVQLSSGYDYEVWSEFEGKKTNTKTLSSFDTRKNSILTLKLK